MMSSFMLKILYPQWLSWNIYLFNQKFMIFSILSFKNQKDISEVKIEINVLKMIHLCVFFKRNKQNSTFLQVRVSLWTFYLFHPFPRLPLHLSALVQHAVWSRAHGNILDKKGDLMGLLLQMFYDESQT